MGVARILRQKSISEEAAKLQAELHIEDEKDECDENETDINEIQNRYKFYPALGKDFLTSCDDQSHTMAHEHIHKRRIDITSKSTVDTEL